VYVKGGSNEAHSVVQYQNLKADLLRQELSTRPNVSNSDLENIVKDLYKGQANPNHVGNGTTMDAIREELLTGKPTQVTFHSLKGEQYSQALKNLLKNSKTLNVNNRFTAERLLQDLTNSLSGK